MTIEQRTTPGDAVPLSVATPAPEPAEPRACECPEICPLDHDN